MHFKDAARRPFSYNRIMDLNSLIDDFRGWLDALTHISWIGTAVTIVIAIVACALVSRLSTITLRKLLKSKKGPLPSVSIFINIARVTIWLIGLSIVLSSCFNVNIGSVITALGIGGIAISLGFQSTLSNLIGGIQIIVIGLVEPGDRISVGNYQGIVHDVTWRHTTITTSRDEKVIIPNSVINSEALVKLPPDIFIKQDITLVADGKRPVGEMISKMEKAVKVEVSKIAVIVTEPNIRLVGMDHTGFKAILTFAVERAGNKSKLVDAAMKAIDSVKHPKEAISEKDKNNEPHPRGATHETPAKGTA